MSRNVSSSILDFFAKRRNQIVTVTEMMEELNLTKTQIQGNISHLQKRSGVQLVTCVAGQAWLLKDGPIAEVKKTTTRMMFEEIGPSKAGFLVIQNTDGKLYKAEEV